MWNPLNWLKILTLIKWVVETTVAAVQWIRDWWIGREKAKQVEKVDEALDKLKDAQTEDEFDKAQDAVVGNKPK